MEGGEGGRRGEGRIVRGGRRAGEWWGGVAWKDEGSGVWEWEEGGRRGR